MTLSSSTSTPPTQYSTKKYSINLAIGAPNIEKVEQESWGEQHPTEEPKLLAAFFKSWVRCRRRKLQRFDLWPNCVGQIDKDVIGSSAMHFLCFVLSMTTCHVHLLIWYFCLIACLLRCFVCLAYLFVCSFICCVCSFALISATNARWRKCLKNSGKLQTLLPCPISW